MRHDADHVRILRLMVTDTYRWRCDWAAWRMRFEHDDHVPGLSLREVAAFVQARALPLCGSGAEASGNILYLRDEEDLPRVFDVFGAILHGLGHISAIQSRDAYEDAARIAVVLAEHHRSPAPVSDPLALPDLQWHVSGQDQFRVARTKVKGHEVVVRFGYLGGHEMWIVDVDGRANCAHFRLRADAMSKLGVGVALDNFLGQSKR
ncbi:MAG: hypothetical protein NT133_21790 [Alphaproteobacteria bacterium]|nr:hypothetical protein [Alphaproteobacteria bacterium]